MRTSPTSDHPNGTNGDFFEAEEDDDESTDNGEKFNSDAVRLYLRSLRKGGPLLEQPEEFALASTLETIRGRYRKMVLSICAHAIYASLQEVHETKVPLGSMVVLKKTEEQNSNMRARLGPNLQTIGGLLHRRRLNEVEEKQSQSPEHKRLTHMHSESMRRHMVTLFEETPVKMDVLKEMAAQAKGHLREMQNLESFVRENPDSPFVSRWNEDLAELREWYGEDGERFRHAMDVLERIDAVHEHYRKKMSDANLRLVVSIAKKYRRRGMSYADLIEEGNNGLMKSVDRFEVRYDTRFSTYATWWIKQGIRHALSQKSRMVRVPAHMVELAKRVRETAQHMEASTGRKPSPEQIAEVLNESEEKVQMALTQGSRKGHHSLDEPSGDYGDDTYAGNMQDTTPQGLAPLDRRRLRELIDSNLEKLTHKEKIVIELRFGLKDGVAYTLREIGEIFLRVTRERVRQIEAKALNKLRHPVFRRPLEQFAPEHLEWTEFQ